MFLMVYKKICYNPMLFICYHCFVTQHLVIIENVIGDSVTWLISL